MESAELQQQAGSQSSYSALLDNLSYAYPLTGVCGYYKSKPEDFIVEEFLDFPFSHEGEHHYLQISKCNLNTADVVEKLAAFCGIKVRDIGYSGLKDKRAWTTQWFSVYLAGKKLNDIDWKIIESFDWRQGEIKLRQAVLHNKKLKRSTHKRNAFTLLLRKLNGSVCEQSSLASVLRQRMNQIEKEGFPNYFGRQRFGINDGNLQQAERLLIGKRKITRAKRSLYLSSVRSFLFNEILSRRVKAQSWNNYISGDRLVLDGSKSFFSIKKEEQAQQLAILSDRLNRMDIHVGGILAGMDGLGVDNGIEYTEQEKEVIERYESFKLLLDNNQMVPGVRPFRAMPTNVSVKNMPDGVLVKFSLPAGSFATALLRELGEFSEYIDQRQHGIHLKC